MRYDLLLKNATVIDPKNRRCGVMDVALRNGRVAAVQGAIAEADAFQAIDLRGRVVTPGLIDAHVHVFFNAWDMGVHTDELCTPSGVTTVCDGGSTGASTFPGLRELVERAIATRCKAFVHLSTIGITGCEIVGELANAKYADREACVRTIWTNRDLAIGVKLRLGPNLTWDPEAALRLAREAADAAQVRLMVHVTNSPIPLPAVLAYLRPGDLLSHCFHAFTHGIFNAERTAILGAIWEAQKQGVLFDSAHGRMGHFNFPLARKAIEVGFLPDVITTDLGRPSAIHGPVFDLATTMSKFLNLGVPLEDIVLRTTYRPAEVLGLAESLGHLSEGAIADIAVLEVQNGEFEFMDTDGNTMNGSRRIAAVMTIRGGRICYQAGEPTGSPSLKPRRWLA